MIRIEGRIQFRDGETQLVTATQAEFAAYEVYALRHGLPPALDQAPVTTMMRYVAYAAAHHDTPPHDWPSYEEWGMRVAEVEFDRDPTSDDLELGGDPTQVFPQVRSAG